MLNCSLLVIERDDKIRQEMVRTLRSHFRDTTVVEAASFAMAYSGGLAQHAMVLCGWDLRDVAGPEMFARLRNQGAHDIVMVTDANCGASAAHAIRLGASDYVVRSADYLITLPLIIEKNLALIELRRERDVLNRQLLDQNETLNQLLKSLEEAAATDPLTGLYNRGHLTRVMDQMFHDAVRSDRDLSCVMLDMDYFKQLNDTHGHQAGDEALIVFANVIQECLRKMDAAARYGGDEFVLLLPNTDVLEASRVAGRIREAYLAHVRSDAFKYPLANQRLGISIGVASVRVDCPAHPEALIGAADAALYAAKRTGRDKIQVSIAARPKAMAG